MMDWKGRKYLAYKGHVPLKSASNAMNTAKIT